MHSILRTHCHGVSAVLHSQHTNQEIEFMTQLLNGIDFAFPLETVYSQRAPHPLQYFLSITPKEKVMYNYTF